MRVFWGCDWRAIRREGGMIGILSNLYDRLLIGTSMDVDQETIVDFLVV